MTQKAIISFTLLLLTYSLQGQFLLNVSYEGDITHMNSGIHGMFEDEDGHKWLYGKGEIARHNGFAWEMVDDVSNLNVTDLSHDSQYLWIATWDEGLFAMDRYGNLIPFADLMSDGSSLKSKNIRRVVSKNGLLFLLTDEGLDIYENEDGQCFLADVKLPFSSSVSRIFPHENTLWMSHDGGTANIDLKNLQYTDHQQYKAKSYFVDQFNKLWISNVDEGTTLLYYDSATQQFHVADYQPYRHYKQPRHFVWLDSERLLSSPKTTVMMEVLNFSDEEKVSIDEALSGMALERQIREMMRDREGKVWLMGNKLYNVPTNSFIKTEYFTGEDEVEELLLKGHKMYMFIANQGLVVSNRNTGDKQIFTNGNSKIEDGPIMGIYDIGDGKIGLSFRTSFQVYSEAEGFGEPFILNEQTYSAYGEEGKIWVGGNGKVFRISSDSREVRQIDLQDENTQIERPIHKIYALNENYLAIGTWNYGIQPLGKLSDSSEVSYALSSILKHRFKIDMNNCFSASPSGKYVARASDKGIFIDEVPVYNPLTQMHKLVLSMEIPGIYKKIVTREAEFNNVLYFDEETLYATSETRLYKIKLSSNQIFSYSRLDGLVNNTFSSNTMVKDTDGYIYVAGDRGIDKIDELSFTSPDISETLQVDNIFFNGVKQIHEKEKMVLIPGDVKVVEIDISNSKIIADEHSRIQVRISPEQDWNDVGDRTRFTLYNPAPGRLNPSFRVVTGDEMVASEELLLEMEIKQVWYRNPWHLAWIACLLLGGLGIGIFYYQRQENKKVREKLWLQKELANLKLTSLNSQMNPHFIFNSLSSIQQLITSGEMLVAEKYLSKFSRLLRHVIQYASLKNVRLTEELDFIRNYLDLELLRFTDAFTYEIQCEVANPEKVFIPPFFLQPQVENALKHGFAEESIANRLLIRISETNSLLQIVVEDNGIGRSAAGIRNTFTKKNTNKGNLLTESRIENLNKLNYHSSFFVEDLYEGSEARGTRVVLEFDHIKSMSS